MLSRRALTLDLQRTSAFEAARGTSPIGPIAYDDFLSSDDTTHDPRRDFAAGF